MEINMNKSQIVALLEEKMKFLEKVLVDTTNIVESGYKIIAGAWSNESGFCSAYLCCIRRPQDESIDLTIDVAFGENTIALAKGIYWSDGSVIQDFGTVELPWTDLHNTRTALDDFFDQLIEKDLQKYSDFVLQQKDEPN